MAFGFNDLIDAENPLDRNDPPPEGWKSIDTHDYRKALFGSRTDVFQACCDWEERELARHKAIEFESICDEAG